MADSKRNKNRCSFCGRSEDEVELLITGMNAFICNQCAQQAHEIVQEALESKQEAAHKLSLKELPKPVDIKKFLDQYVSDRMMPSVSFPYRFIIIISDYCRKPLMMM